MKPPKGIIISEHEQGTEGWLEARRAHATASPAGNMMKRLRNGKYNQAREDYVIQLALEEITGTTVPFHPTVHMKWGTEQEPIARLAYELATGNTVTETGFWHFEGMKVGASVDGLVGDDGLVEIKNPKSSTHLMTLNTQEVPEFYYWQIVQQLYVTNRKWCDYVSYDSRMPDNARRFIKRVYRNDEDVYRLEKELHLLLADVNKQIKYIKEYKES